MFVNLDFYVRICVVGVHSIPGLISLEFSFFCRFHSSTANRTENAEETDKENA